MATSTDNLTELARKVLSHDKLLGNSFAQSLLTQLEKRGGLSPTQMGYVLGTVNPRGYPTFQVMVGMEGETITKTAETKTIEAPVSTVFSNTGPGRARQTTPETPIKEEIPCSEYPLMKFPYEKFNPVQSLVFENYDKDENLVVAATTSAGKTCMAEMVMAHCLEVQKKKCIFLSPLKAVTKEKYDDWTKESHPFSKYNISIVTGDFVLTDARKKELEEANIILLTSEMLDSRTRNIHVEKNQWLLEAGLIVADEAHLLTVEGRGDNLESGLMRFSKLVQSARVVLLSATMPNMKELADWLTHLNGKTTSWINSSWRPCQLDIHYVRFNDKGQYGAVEQRKIQQACQIIREYPRDKFILFVHSKRTGAFLTSELQKLGEKAAFHYGDLLLPKRLKIEHDFKDKNSGLRIVVSTSTLAWGINMPARRVVILGVTRGYNPVSSIDLRQMAGRAGRVGLDPKGDVYLLTPASEALQVQHNFENVEEVISCLKDRDNLAFHIVSEVARGNVTDVASLIEWYNRSLASFQGITLDNNEAELIFRDLISIKAITKEGAKYQITELGKISSDLYLSPFDVYAWYMNFSTVFKLKLKENDLAVAWALTDTPANSMLNPPAEIEEQCSVMQGRLQKIGIRGGANPLGLYLWYRLRGATVPQELRQYATSDIDRTLLACSRISLAMKWYEQDFFTILQVRIETGAPYRLASLMSVKGIGKTLAEKLVNGGVKDRKDLVKKASVAKSILGAKRFDNIVKSMA